MNEFRIRKYVRFSFIFLLTFFSVCVFLEPSFVFAENNPAEGVKEENGEREEIAESGKCDAKRDEGGERKEEKAVQKSVRFSVPLERQAFYYTQAVRNYEKNLRRLETEGEPWENFGVRMPADCFYAYTAAEVFFHENPPLRCDFTSGMPVTFAESVRLLARIRTMQELSPDSPFCGNFRWYWHQKTVEDRNAAEFVVHRLVFCWKHRDVLPEACLEPLRQILTDAAAECFRRPVTAEYTNIAVLNFCNLILLGETLNVPELKAEGVRRMNRFVFRTWRCGVHEFASPTYFAVTLEALAQLQNLTEDDGIRHTAQALLEFWAKIISLHLTPSGTLAGACSRTYNYMYGDVYLQHHVAVWGWSPLPEKSDITLLAALTGGWNPDFTPCFRTDSAFPRTVAERWGEGADEVKTTFLTSDFSVGTSASAYFSHQDQLWCVDWNPPVTELETGNDISTELNSNKNSKIKSKEQKNIRTFFVPDGRGDPWGVSREVTNGGHQKAFHLDPIWSAVQCGAQTRCKAVYSEAFLQDFREKNPNGILCSVFVLKRPDSYTLNLENPVPSLVLRYGKYELSLRIESAPDAEAASELTPSPAGDAVAWSVTHRADVPSEIVFTSNIVPISESGSEPEKCSFPSGPLLSPCEILEVNGTAVGRAFLEEHLPELHLYAAREAAWNASLMKIFAENQPESSSEIPAETSTGTSSEDTWECASDDSSENPSALALLPGETLRLPAVSGLFFAPFSLPDGSVTIQNTSAWRLNVKTPGKYVLSALVLAPDPRRDSLCCAFLTSEQLRGIHEEYRKRQESFQECSETHRFRNSTVSSLPFSPQELMTHVKSGEFGTFFPCWALGNSPSWRTVSFRFSGSSNPRGILNLSEGPFVLILAPRELDVRVKELIFERVE